MHVVTTDKKKPYILKRVWGCIQKDLEEEKKKDKCCKYITIPKSLEKWPLVFFEENKGNIINQSTDFINANELDMFRDTCPQDVCNP